MKKREIPLAIFALLFALTSLIVYLSQPKEYQTTVRYCQFIVVYELPDIQYPDNRKKDQKHGAIVWQPLNKSKDNCADYIWEINSGFENIPNDLLNWEYQPIKKLRVSYQIIGYETGMPQFKIFRIFEEKE